MLNPSEADTTSSQQQQGASLHQAAWLDMLSSLHVAYGDLTRTQLELERRMTEIDETRELFERVIESMSEALFLMDVTGRIIRANRAAGALLECELATFIGKLFVHICQTADVPATPWRLLERAPNGVLTDIDVELRSHSGCVIPVSMSCVLVRDRQGKVMGVLAMARTSPRVYRLKTRSGSYRSSWCRPRAGQAWRMWPQMFSITSATSSTA